MTFDTKLDDSFPEAQFYTGLRAPFTLGRNKHG